MRRFPSIPSFSDFNKVVLGVIGIALTGAVIAVGFAVGTLGLLENRYEMSGAFTDSGGLKSGAPVRIAGIQVGKVTDVSPDYSSGQVVITWGVDAGVHVGPQTRAEIGTATLLGGDFLRLEDTEGGQALAKLPKAQRRIPLERTKTPYTVINAFGDVTHQIQSLDVATFNTVIKQIAGDLGRNATNLPDLVTNLSRLGAAVGARQTQLDQLIADGEQVTTTLASRDQQLGQLIDQAGGLLDALNTRRDQLTALLGSTNSTVNQLAGLIETKRTQIGAILDAFHTTLGGVQRELPAINEGLAYAGPTLLGLSSVVGPNQFNVGITGIGPASLDNLNRLLDALLGPGG